MNSNVAEKLKQEKYSYDDLLKFTDEKRYEIIDGVLFVMDSPSVLHQSLAGEIFNQIKNYLKGKPCKVFSAPLDIKISGEKDNKKERNVVQPDILVVCDKDKIQRKNILGAPDFVAEIISPSTSGRDRVEKLNLYQKYGVREYWLVSPAEKAIMVFLLNEQGIYTIPKAYYLEEKIKVNIFDDLYISLKEFIEENKELIEQEQEEDV